jgi:hypothetical protein
MPDSMPEEPFSQATDGNDLEKLVAEAEVKADADITTVELARAASAVNVPIAHQPKPCIHTDTLLNAVCPLCKWPFCVECASLLDPTYCHLCLNESDAELKELPLIDSNGEQHDGRRLVPADDSIYTPLRFMTLTHSISEMSDHELEDYIQHYKDLVHQAEKALDFRRIVLSTSQLESSQRQDIKRRKLRSDKSRYPIKTVTVDTKTGKTKTTTTASATKLLDVMKMLEVLANAKAKNK